MKIFSFYSTQSHTLSHSISTICTLILGMIQVSLYSTFLHTTYMENASWNKQRNWLIIKQWSKFYSVHFVWTCCALGLSILKQSSIEWSRGFRDYTVLYCFVGLTPLHVVTWPSWPQTTIRPTKIYNTAKYSEGADLNIIKVHQYRYFLNSEQYQSAWPDHILNIKSCMGSYRITTKVTTFVTAAFSHYE